MAERKIEFDDEVALVRAARAGDRAAFGALYERYARMVHGIMLAHAPAQAADDLVQDVFERALRQLPKLREVNAFAGWLIAIARNRLRDHYRRGVQDEPDEKAPEIAVHEAAPAQAEAAAALEAIRQLPEAYRETLMMRLVEGMTGPEIAARTGLTHDSVRVNLHRGMKMLRERMK